MKTTLNIFACLLLAHSLLANVASHSHADEIDYVNLERAVQQVVENVRPASVSISDGEGDASGVIVSSEGHVLTAGHCVGRSGTEFVVVLPDGREFDAIGMGMEPIVDCGLIKILDPVDLPFVELGWSSDLQENQPCISLGHCHGFNPDRGPVVRFGRIVDPFSAVNGYIQSTCLMEPGDSGGPLFDLNGRVIGIHSQIDESLDSNFEVPIDVFRRYWEQLNTAEKFRATKTEAGPVFGIKLPSTSMSSEFGFSSKSVRVRDVEDNGWAATQGLKKRDKILSVNGRKVRDSNQLRMILYRHHLSGDQSVNVEVSRDKQEKTLRLDFSAVETANTNEYSVYPDNGLKIPTPPEWNDFVAQFEPLENQLDDFCAEVVSDKSGKSRNATGLFLTHKGSNFVLCKRSLIGDNPQVIGEDGEVIAAETVANDVTNDLLLLSLSADPAGLTPVSLEQQPDSSELGEFFISPDSQSTGEISVRGTTRFSATNQGFFGVMPEEDSGKVVLSEIVEDGPAEAAGFKIDDQITFLAGTAIESPMDLVEALSGFQAGEKIEVKGVRNDEELVKQVILGVRPGTEVDEEEEMFGQDSSDFIPGGQSRIRYGFSEVIVHDARVKSTNCGGPVFDTDRNLVGVNIARFSRTQCYILPTSVIRNFVAQSLENRDSGATNGK